MDLPAWFWVPALGAGVALGGVLLRLLWRA